MKSHHNSINRVSKTIIILFIFSISDKKLFFILFFFFFHICRDQNLDYQQKAQTVSSLIYLTLFIAVTYNYIPWLLCEYICAYASVGGFLCLFSMHEVWSKICYDIGAKVRVVKPLGIDWPWNLLRIHTKWSVDCFWSMTTFHRSDNETLSYNILVQFHCL